MTTAWAMRRRRRFERDDRPDWRDPAMPVWLWAESWNDGRRGWRLVPPDVAHYAAEQNMRDNPANVPQPTWDRDPSYFWRAL